MIKVQMGEIPTFVTHNSIFHTDDVFATAFLLTVFPEAKIIRTRNPKTIASADLVYDVGMEYDPDKLRFDHHQKTFDERNPEGWKYSSFGLVWKHLGYLLVPDTEQREGIRKVLVAAIDAYDNGQDLITHDYPDIGYPNLQWVIHQFRPRRQLNEDVTECFYRAVEFATHILQRTILSTGEFLEAKRYIARKIESTFPRDILVLDRDLPWKKALHLVDPDGEVKMVVYEAHDGNWRAQCRNIVPDKFPTYVSHNPDWRGLEGEAIIKKTGLPSAQFCHVNGFTASASDLETAMIMAEEALKFPNN